MHIFLKLGGSLITDKNTPETPRIAILERIASEIAQARTARPDLRLVIGHGSGSFGHIAAKRYGTRHGAVSTDEWQGFAEVAHAAGRLNEIVLASLRAAGLPVLRFQPSASAICDGGRLSELALEPITAALSRGLIPLVYGDVAFDRQQGATIISTEDVFSYLAQTLHPDHILLSGEVEGVLDANGQVIPWISARNRAEFTGIIGGSAATDVTGGMETKVDTMLALCEAVPGLTITIFSGLQGGMVQTALREPTAGIGTRLTA